MGSFLQQKVKIVSNHSTSMMFIAKDSNRTSTSQNNKGLCPYCQAPDETHEHILHCAAPTVVTAHTAALKKISKLDKRGFTT
jgi:hypothetical protein